MALADESLSQILLIAMVVFPRVEAKQNGTYAQSLDLTEVAVWILWPRANCETNSLEGLRVFVKIGFELAVPASDLCSRSCNDAKVSEVRWAVGETNSEFLAAAGMLVGLVREVVPHSLVP
jgi:hypothetical protein